MSYKAMPDAAYRAVVDHGHDMAWDPPAALTSRRRWTCARRGCGKAVLVAPDDRFYGSAATDACTGKR